MARESTRSGSSRPGEVPSLVTWLSAAIALTMIAQQIASKAVRDGLFLSQFPATALPHAIISAAVVSFGAAFVFGRFISTFSPRRGVPILFGVNGALFVIEAALMEPFPRAVAGSLYLHTAAFGGAVVSGFWSVINERFDPYTAKRVMGRIAAGATLGGLVGGALTWAFSDLAPSHLLAALAVGNGLCGVTLTVVARGGVQEERERSRSAGMLAGIEAMGRNPHLKSMALLVFLGALTTALVDYVFKAEASQAQSGSLVAFFAAFYTGTGILTFLVQAALSNRVLERLGVAVAVVCLPVVTILGLIAALLAPVLGVLIVLRGGAMIVENSLYRSGYELLYTPVTPKQKRGAKMLIDLGVDRLGTAVGSGLALLFIAVAAAYTGKILLGIGLVVSVLLVVVIIVVHRRYVASLADQIRRARENLGANPTADARNLAYTFVDSAVQHAWAGHIPDLTDSAPTLEAPEQLPRSDLVALVKKRAENKRSAAKSLPPPPAVPVSEVAQHLLQTPLLDAISSCTIDSPQWQELERTAPAALGQLTDILLSVRYPVEVRVRAAQLLSSVPDSRTAAALTQALEVAEFRIRRAAALALLRLCASVPALSPPRRVLSQRAAHELRHRVRPPSEETTFEQRSPFRTDESGRKFAPNFELSLILLAIGADLAALQLAVAAVTSDDAVQRGTGLEYLDTLLPADVRQDVLELARAPEQTQVRRTLPDGEMKALADQFRSGKLDLRKLRRQFRLAVQQDYDQAQPESPTDESPG